jgi:hypothetical protein
VPSWACCIVAQNCSKLLKTAQNCSKLLKTAQNCSKLLKTAQNCSKLLKTVKLYFKWLRNPVNKLANSITHSQAALLKIA